MIALLAVIGAIVVSASAIEVLQYPPGIHLHPKLLVPFNFHAVPVRDGSHSEQHATHHADSHQAHTTRDPHHTPPNFDFSYAVHDSRTGDIKSQQETRRRDAVVGSYSVVDPDGFKRTVDYTSDHHNGFQAVVRREPIAHHHHL